MKKLKFWKHFGEQGYNLDKNIGTKVKKQTKLNNSRKLCVLM